MVGEIERITALIAQEVAIDAALVAVVAAHDLGTFVGGTHTEGCLAAVAAVRADRRDVIHLPGPGLVAIGTGGQRADRANIDTHAALFAVQARQVVRRKLGGNVGSNDGSGSAVLDAKCEHVHAFAAHAHAAVAKNAAWAIKEDDRGPLLLFAMVLGLGVEAFPGAVLVGHVLQLALAAGVAHGAVKRVIAEQKFERGLAGLRDLGRFGLHNHARGDRGGAGGLQLGQLFDPHDAHAAGSLQREAGVVAKGGNFDTGGLAGVDEQRARGGGECFAVYGERYVWHVRCPYGLNNVIC